MVEFALGLFIGLFLFIGYVAHRALKSPKWDDSNLTNVIRLIAHVALHPEDFGKMTYPDGSYPFWYINKDEFEGVVKTRPKK